MRALGYPRLISMENFRNPNFELVADILYWMVKLYDPEANLSEHVEFEDERVKFLTDAASLLAAKARLKMNTKKLYASDGRAVQELLKLATLLYSATKSISNKNIDETVPPSIRVQDIKAARVLASDITQSGAKLYDLLANEKTERAERSRALRFLDLSTSTTDGPREQAYIERSIKDLIEHTKQALEDMKKESEELDADERNIENKIKKKQEELERTEKRLKSLENVKPQFMEETEKLEKELQRYYEIYMDKHRNLDYLEWELDKYRRNEEERKEEQDQKLKKMRERLYKDEVELMRGGAGGVRGKDNGDRAYAGKDHYGDYGGKGGDDLLIQGRGAKVQGMMDRRSDDEDDSLEGSRQDDDSRESSDDGSLDQEDDDDDEELSVNNEGKQAGNSRRPSGHGATNDRRRGVAVSDDEEFLDDDGGDEDDDDNDNGGEFSGDNSEEDF